MKRGEGGKKIANISAAAAPLKRRRCGRCCGAEIGLKAPGRQHEKKRRVIAGAGGQILTLVIIVKYEK